MIMSRRRSRSSACVETRKSRKRRPEMHRPIYRSATVLTLACFVTSISAPGISTVSADGTCYDSCSQWVCDTVATWVDDWCESCSTVCDWCQDCGWNCDEER